jgi:hypothetical protein
MKRKEKTIPKGHKWFKKLGGGSFLTTIEGKQRIIKRNQEFHCRPEDIPDNFRDAVVPLDGSGGERISDLEPQSTASPPVPLEYFVKPKGGGFYDVVDKDGKIQNQKGLREDKAKELIESLRA